MKWNFSPMHRTKTARGRVHGIKHSYKPTINPLTGDESNRHSQTLDILTPELDVVSVQSTNGFAAQNGSYVEASYDDRSHRMRSIRLLEPPEVEEAARKEGESFARLEEMLPYDITAASKILACRGGNIILVRYFKPYNGEHHELVKRQFGSDGMEWHHGLMASTGELVSATERYISLIERNGCYRTFEWTNPHILYVGIDGKLIYERPSSSRSS